MPTRVIVLSEDTLAKSDLTRMLAADPDLLFVESADEAELALVDAARTADRTLDPPAGLPFIVLLERPENAAAALADGARGVFLRSGDPGLWSAGIHAAQRGAIVLDPAVATEILRRRPELDLPSRDHLTAREREVLDLLAEGLSNKAIARALAVTDHTAKFHVTAIMNKLGAETRTEAVVLAARLGLVEL